MLDHQNRRSQSWIGPLVTGKEMRLCCCLLERFLFEGQGGIENEKKKDDPSARDMG